MNTFETTAKSLTAFLQDADQRVFALKGPWGVGKSFFVRKFLANENNKGLLPPYTSYASMFGLRNIQEVRDVINGCMDSVNHPMVAKVGRKLANATKIKIPVPGASFELADLTNSAFWYLAKHQGALIVLDDLERTHDDLDLEQLLGLASSLTENSKAKVLLILNEQRLGDDSAAIAQYREKVIDVELRFRPDTRSLVQNFLHEPSQVDCVTTCLEAGEGSNIRLIFRINRTLRQFRESAISVGLRFGNDDLSQIAKIVWLYYVTPLPLTNQLVTDAWMQNFWNRKSDKELSKSEEEFFIRAGKIGLQPGRFDALILEYLADGYFSEISLSKAVEEIGENDAKDELDRRVREAFGPYTNNFRASESEVTAPVKRLLDDYAECLGLDRMRAYAGFLESLDVATDEYWYRHVKAVAPKLSVHECHNYLSFLRDADAKKIIQARLTADTGPFDPKVALLRMAREQRWIQEQVEALEKLDVGFYLEWFKSEEGDFLEALRSALEFFAMGSRYPAANELHRKLVGVLERIAKESRVSQMRVRGILRITDGGSTN